MKSRYIASTTESEKLARKVAQEEIDKCYDKWAQQCCYHALAVAFAVLHRDFGFGAERLKKLKRGIESELAIMEHGFLGKQYSESDIREWLLSIGIDLERGENEQLSCGNDSEKGECHEC